MENIIDKLKKVGIAYFGKSFHFKTESNLYIAKSENKSSALNHKKNDIKEVNVINWFDDIWSYIEIKFIPKLEKNRNIPNIFFSLSVFQGHSSDNKKQQFFRAEWDNYDEPNNEHPQPHWHFYTRKDVEYPQDFNDVIKSDENEFNSYIGNNSNKILNIDKFHFAMNAHWSENKTDVHSISTESNLLNWFRGLLNHLNKELKYLKEK